MDQEMPHGDGGDDKNTGGADFSLLQWQLV
jgi:hypothetical protein